MDPKRCCPRVKQLLPGVSWYVISTTMYLSLSNVESAIWDTPQSVCFLISCHRWTFEWITCTINMSKWGNWGPEWGGFLQGWSTEWPDNIGISICRQLFWALHPSPPLPGVVPGEGSTSQPNVPDVHCCNHSIFNSCTNQKRVQSKTTKKSGKHPNNRPWNEGWKGLVELPLTRVTGLRL